MRGVGLRELLRDSCGLTKITKSMGGIFPTIITVKAKDSLAKLGFNYGTELTEVR
jgi:hypothetical protein